MILRNLIFYTVSGSILWSVAGRLGANFALNMAISMLVPPALMLGYALYKNRGPLL